jgi:hypothetical protein
MEDRYCKHGSILRREQVSGPVFTISIMIPLKVAHHNFYSLDPIDTVD